MVSAPYAAPDTKKAVAATVLISLSFIIGILPW